MEEYITHKVPGFNADKHLLIATPVDRKIVNGVVRSVLSCKCHCNPTIQYETAAIRVIHNFVPK